VLVLGAGGRDREREIGIAVGGGGGGERRQIPTGDVGLGVADRRRETVGAVAEDRADRNAGDLERQFLRPVGVGQGRIDRQRDGSVLVAGGVRDGERGE